MPGQLRSSQVKPSHHSHGLTVVGALCWAHRDPSPPHWPVQHSSPRSFGSTPLRRPAISFSAVLCLCFLLLFHASCWTPAIPSVGSPAVMWRVSNNFKQAFPNLQHKCKNLVIISACWLKLDKTADIWHTPRLLRSSLWETSSLHLLISLTISYKKK